MIDKETMKLFESLSETNDKFIESGDSITPMCFMIENDDKATAIALMFNNGDEKIAMREMLLKFIAEHEVKAYILIQDCLMTKIDQKTSKHETMDVVMRQIFTPKEKYIVTVKHKDGKIIKKKVLPKEMLESMKSEWNLWETVEFKDYDNEVYEKIKLDNPEQYKEVA